MVDWNILPLQLIIPEQEDAKVLGQKLGEFERQPNGDWLATCQRCSYHVTVWEYLDTPVSMAYPPALRCGEEPNNELPEMA
jgi:hypothetical protein